MRAHHGLLMWMRMGVKAMMRLLGEPAVLEGRLLMLLLMRVWVLVAWAALNTIPLLALAEGRYPCWTGGVRQSDGFEQGAIRRCRGRPDVW